MSRLFSGVPRRRKTVKSYICPVIRDGGCDGELVQIHHHPAQKQEQWKPGLGEDQAYRRDEDRGDVGRMENGTYHYPLIWDNAADVKRRVPRCGLPGSPFMAHDPRINHNGEWQWRNFTVYIMCKNCVNETRCSKHRVSGK